jgi:hypothetical protein
MSTRLPRRSADRAPAGRFADGPTGHRAIMLRVLRSVANPFTRTALIAFAWSHRRTIMRWGRSLWSELRRPARIEPGRLMLIGKVLYAITRDDHLAHSKQLRHVSLDGSTVVIDASPGWKGSARLVDELSGIDGVTAITDTRGAPLRGSIPATAAG